MATPAQRKRLIEGLAYIHSHPKQWIQCTWHSLSLEAKSPGCGTFGCLAGHLAITLNPSRPAVVVPPEILKKSRLARTADEQTIYDAAEVWGDYVLATRADDPDVVEKITVLGKTVEMVHVRNRASRLIGDLNKNLDNDVDLFEGDNKWPDMVRLGAKALGITQRQLLKEINEVVLRRGWVSSGKKVKA